MKILISLYLLYMFVAKVLGVFDYMFIYTILNNTDSIMMRDEYEFAFFYKGFVFLPAASVWFYNNKNYIWFFLSVIAIYFTFTRGFYVMLLFGLFINYAFINKISPKNVLIVLVVSLVFYELISIYEIFSTNEARQGGDIERINTFYQVMERITPFSFLFGHGFGQGVPVREVHMEVSYLEIFHKQGLLGLSFWGFLFIKILNMRHFPYINNKSRKCVDFFVLSSMMIYVQSIFNPYIINPIGMTMVILSYICCKFIIKNEIAMYSGLI